jgi:hypothetical protein
MEVQQKSAETLEYGEKARRLYEELQIVSERVEKQKHNNKLKGQLEEIRRRMN